MRFLPVSLFDDAPDAYFLTGEGGRIEYLNAAAARFLGCEPAVVLGKCCREAGFRLQAPDGHPYSFAAGCPIQRMMLRGHPPERPFEVVLVRCGGTRVDASLESFPVSPPKDGGVAMLHRLAPRAEDTPSDSLPGVLREAESRVPKLSRRETEILEKLSKGTQTDEIANALFISHETVRNHIRHILDKLGVHHRIDAVVAWLSARERKRAAIPSRTDPDGSSRPRHSFPQK